MDNTEKKRCRAEPHDCISSAPAVCADDQETHKRQIYNAMSPRRRRFVDRIGYEAWDPFQKPKEPLDMRTDNTRRTAQQLMRLFLREKGLAEKTAPGNAYIRGALECAFGIVNQDETYQGIYEFCLWHHSLVCREQKERP